MKKVFLLFIFININVFAQEHKITLTKQLDWMPVKNQAGLMGFVNSKGKEIVPCKYTKIDLFDENKIDWALVRDERGFFGFINSKGKEIVPCKYSSIDLFGSIKENWAR